MRKRLRKKLRLREFVQLAFTARYQVKPGLSSAALDSLLDRFILEAIEANGLHCGGGGGQVEWDFTVCANGRRSSSEADRQQVRTWLEPSGRSHPSSSDSSRMLGMARMTHARNPMSGTPDSNAVSPTKSALRRDGRGSRRSCWRGVASVIIALMAFGSSGLSDWPKVLAKDQGVRRTAPWRRMADGKEWTVENLSVETARSHCYDDAKANCGRYGRLYTWDAAQSGCQLLGGGWRLPTEDEWRQLARHYGGASEDSDDRGKAAYAALSMGGSSGFGALLGGGRSDSGEYARIEAHGFYWTASEDAPSTAWFYNFGKNGLALHRQSEGEKERAFSVRCVKE